MNREIKFRAWDKQDKRWISNIFYISDYGSIYQHEKHPDNDLECIDDDVIIQQFTGLKDKNGKEIYEGDIIKLYGWGVSDEYIGTAKIYWDDQFYQWDYEMIDGDLIDDRYDIWRASREVIGNIFENPELINQP